MLECHFLEIRNRTGEYNVVPTDMERYLQTRVLGNTFLNYLSVNGGSGTQPPIANGKIELFREIRVILTQIRSGCCSRFNS